MSQTLESTGSRNVCVDYAYPSSDNAQRFGFNHHGCYVLSIYQGWNRVQAIDAFQTLEEAVTAATLSGLPISRYSMRKPIQDSVWAVPDLHCSDCGLPLDEFAECPVRCGLGMPRDA